MAGQRLLVTIGTDGVTDWVRTPDGQKFNLGPISTLRFVSHLAPRHIAQALDMVLAGKEAMLSVDEGQMWELLAPHRARWSNVSSSMTLQKTGSPTRKNYTMTTFADDLTALERHITALNEGAAKKASNMAEGVRVLIRLANKIKSPHQSDNSTYYNLGEPKVHEVGDKVAGLSFDVYTANTELANQILAKSEETVKQIDKLASAGRKFNANRAKNDVREVTVKVAGILATDLTASWVQGDLTKLAARANELHGLFVKAKV